MTSSFLLRSIREELFLHDLIFKKGPTTFQNGTLRALTRYVLPYSTVVDFYKLIALHSKRLKLGIGMNWDDFYRIGIGMGLIWD